MTYYRECKHAFLLIEKLIKQQSGTITEADLIYSVTTKYKIGALTIKKRLRLLEEICKINVKDGIIYEVIEHDERKPEQEQLPDDRETDR